SIDGSAGSIILASSSNTIAALNFDVSGATPGSFLAAAAAGYKQLTTSGVIDASSLKNVGTGGSLSFFSPGGFVDVDNVSQFAVRGRQGGTFQIAAMGDVSSTGVSAIGTLERGGSIEAYSGIGNLTQRGLGASFSLEAYSGF